MKPASRKLSSLVVVTACVLLLPLVFVVLLEEPVLPANIDVVSLNDELVFTHKSQEGNAVNQKFFITCIHSNTIEIGLHDDDMFYVTGDTAACDCSLKVFSDKPVPCQMLGEGTVVDYSE